jgi:hypothetical protein
MATINLMLGQPSFLPNSNRMTVMSSAAMANRGVMTPSALAPWSYAVLVIDGTTANPMLEAMTNSVPDNLWFVAMTLKH